MFKVVSEQLRLHKGKVRCGQCQEVFDGLAHLQLVSNDAPTNAFEDSPPVLAQVIRAAAPEPVQAKLPEAASVQASPVTSEQSPLFADLPEHEALDTAIFIDATSESASPQALHSLDVHTLPMFNEAGAVVEKSLTPQKPTRPVEQSIARLAPHGRPSRTAFNEPDAVDFFAGGASEQHTLLRSASHLVPATIVILALLACFQMAIIGRNWISAWAPDARPAISRICATLGLSVSSPRMLKALSLSSAEVRATGNPDEFQLTAMLTNRASHSIAIPNVELVLNNPQGEAMIRRLLTSSELLSGAQSGTMSPPLNMPDTQSIASNTERELRLVFSVPNIRFSDYTVALVYP